MFLGTKHLNDLSSRKWMISFNFFPRVDQFLWLIFLMRFAPKIFSIKMHSHSIQFLITYRSRFLIVNSFLSGRLTFPNIFNIETGNQFGQTLLLFQSKKKPSEIQMDLKLEARSFKVEYTWKITKKKQINFRALNKRKIDIYEIGEEIRLVIT